MFEYSDGYGHGPGIGPGLELDKERAKATFSVESMTNLIYGGAEKVRRRRFINALVERDPTFRKWDNCFLSRTQMYERALEKTARYIELSREHKLEETNDLVWFRTAIDENLPIGLHHSMFLPTLEGQLTDEQQQRWLPLARNYAIVGTYAQTEIAHGSFVRGLQTSATFDPQADEFDLHTPSQDAIKWWPGNLGKTANVIILMARLVVHGKDFGIHPFIVPIRHPDTHLPLAGVTVGDLGPKYAYEANDNGFLRLDHVRIPRSHMCARFASLSQAGEYRPSINAKLSYGTMVFVRSWIVIEASRYLARALTVAVRYSAVRLQFPKETDHNSSVRRVGGHREEAQVLEYQTQQHQLFPLLATAFAFHFTGAYMKKLYYKNLQQLESGDVSLLKEVHVNSSGLKALTTGVTSDAIEVARKCCGGHGYSRFSGLIDLYGNYVPACTYEGDNTIMFLQTARELVHVWNAARGIRSHTPSDQETAVKKEKDAPTAGGKKRSAAPQQHSPTSLQALYASDHFVNDKSTIGTLDDTLSLTIAAKAFHHRASRLLSSTCTRLNGLVQLGHTFEVSYEMCKVDLVRCAKAHCWMLILNNFIDALKHLRTPSLLPVLTTLARLFALAHMEKEMGEFLEDGFLSAKQADWVRESVRNLLALVRVDAVSIVDSFDFSDHYLNSALGKWDGNVYECLYDWARTSNPMNASELGPGVERILLPLMKEGRKRAAEEQSAGTLKAKL